MHQPSPPKETMYFGGSSHRPPQITQLRAGALTCQYEEGNLRSIRVGEVELLRMIYSAVRDQNWNTIAPIVSQEKIEQSADSFLITYDCRYQEGDIDFSATFSIILKGRMDGRVLLQKKGLVLNSCLYMCGRNPQCNTVNYKENELICELMSKRYNNTQLTNQKDWEHFDTVITEDIVSLIFIFLNIFQCAITQCRNFNVL